MVRACVLVSATITTPRQTAVKLARTVQDAQHHASLVFGTDYWSDSTDFSPNLVRGRGRWEQGCKKDDKY